MMGFSIYLTKHFFDLKFPSGLEGKSLCNVNQFFNCDKTTQSKLSMIFGVPISLFGILIGLIVFCGQILKNQNYDRTSYFILIINFAGCLILFTYSLLILNGLCPFCTLYYIASGLTLFLFYKKRLSIRPATNFLLLFALTTLLLGGLARIYIDKKLALQSSLSADVIKQFYSMKNIGSPVISSEFKIASAINAPIKMIIFSDFECPTCKVFSEMLPQIVNRYQDKIDIQYFFYPLDNACNPNVPRKIHPNACKAAYIASCIPIHAFAKSHDELFMNQEKFNSGFLEQFIKAHNLEACVSDPKTKEKILSLTTAATPYNLNVTPTYIINGVKLEGIVPIEALIMIFDEIVRRSEFGLK